MIRIDMEDRTDVKRRLIFVIAFFLFFNTAVLFRLYMVIHTLFFFQVKINFPFSKVCLLWWRKHWSISQKSNILILYKFKLDILSPS